MIAEAAKKNFARYLAVGLASSEFREGAARANHRIEQTPSGKPVAKIEAVAENALDAEVIGERAHDVVESLAHEHNVGTRCDDFF